LGKKYFEKKLAKMNGLEPDEVNIIYPASIDELIAQDENDMFLSKNKLTMVVPEDNDYEHLQIHSKASETAAKAAHIHAHKTQMMLKRKQPELFTPPTSVEKTTTPTTPGATTTTPPSNGTPTTPNISSITPSAAAAKTVAATT
jgi:hypothetical protein